MDGGSTTYENRIVHPQSSEHHSRDGCEAAPKPLLCGHMARSKLAGARPPDALWLGLVMALALALRLGLAAGNSGLTMDSPLYVRMAEDLAAGRRGASPAHHGYPALLALASFVLPGRELPGRAVSILAS